MHINLGDAKSHHNWLALEQWNLNTSGLIYSIKILATGFAAKAKMVVYFQLDKI